MREFAYRLRWGDLPQSDGADLAHVVETRAGAGGVSGVINPANKRKFVIDFKGGFLSRLTQAEALTPVVAASGGDLVAVTLDRVDGSDLWRVVLDVQSDSALVELSVHIAGYGRKLTETWLYQWIRPHA
jgi:glucans biosynthesis protein